MSYISSAHISVNLKKKYKVRSTRLYFRNFRESHFFGMIETFTSYIH